MPHPPSLHTRRAPDNGPRELWSPHQPIVVGDASQRRIMATMNTGRVDRYGTRILPAGMLIEPGAPLALLFNHDSRTPAGRIETIRREADAITIEGVITDERVWNLVRSGAVTGTSIGFKPIQWEADPNNDEVDVCSRWELCECSICAVPANIDARIEEVRSFTRTPEDHMPPFQQPVRQEPAPAGPRIVESVPLARPAITQNRAMPFNVARVWGAMVENRAIDGFEGEVCAELEKRSSVKTRGVRLPAALFKRAISTDPGSIGALSPTAYLGQLLDDTAAARKWGSLLPRLSFTQITTSRESVAIPKRDTRIQASWGSKDAPAAESEWTADDDTLSPTYIKVTATIERSALKYGDPSSLQLTLSDIGDAMDSGADTGLLYGTGANSQPTGLLTQPGRTVDMAGASVTSQNLMDFKNFFLNTWKMDTADASTRWLMNQRSWDALRVTSKKAGAGATEEWPTGIAPFDATESVLFNIAVIQSGKVEERPPAGSGLFHIALIHGRMGVVVWFAGGSVDTIVDGMTLSNRGAVRISAFLDCNAVIRDKEIVHMLANVKAEPPAAGAPLAGRRAPAAA